jgi:VanZ family protein
LRDLKWLRWWWPALVWAAIIATFSTDTFSADHTSRIIIPFLHWLFPTMPGRTLGMLHHYIRKAAHVGEFFLLSLFLVRGIRGERRGWQFSWAVTAVAIAAGWAALDELHQGFVPSRGPSMRDVLIDISGAVLAQLFYVIILRIRWGRLPAAELSR